MEPKQHLIALARRHPGLWREAEKLRVRMGDSWPTWCYLPAPAWSVALGGGMAPPPTPAHVIDSGIAAAVGAWRMTQGIYRFDAGLYQALIATPVQGDIPVDVLYRMPEWCVYVETPGLVYAAEGSAMNVAGAWLHLDYGHKTGQTKLRAVLNAGETLTLRVRLPDDSDPGDEWTRVDDFLASGRESRHYTLNPTAGVIRFGDGERARRGGCGRAEHLSLIHI